jgi:uncharacterized membrane protein YphA (DoxX/SURF4 family)
MSIDLGLLVLRLVIGLVVAAHGAQKLFGWFGGPGAYSLDAQLGISLPGWLFWAGLAVVALVVVYAVALTQRKVAVNQQAAS